MYHSILQYIIVYYDILWFLGQSAGFRLRRLGIRSCSGLRQKGFELTARVEALPIWAFSKWESKLRKNSDLGIRVRGYPACFQKRAPRMSTRASGFDEEALQSQTSSC